MNTGVAVVVFGYVDDIEDALASIDELRDRGECRSKGALRLTFGE